MNHRQLDQLLRAAAPPRAGAVREEFAAGVLGSLRCENPWVRDWRRFLWCWVPLGLLLIVILALAVSLLPHGEHESAAAPPGEEEP